MSFADAKNIYCLGIGGIGVSAIAKLFYLQGKTVAGWDMARSEITDELIKMGIEVIIRPEVNLPQAADLLIYSPAVPADNIARRQARERGILELSYPEILGEISRTKKTIAVGGTHGKSTTTALVGLLLEAAGYDPLVIVGSIVKSFKYGNLRPGQGDYFVVEGCEHQANMLKIQPETIVITNLEPDHLDYYRDLEHIKEAFRQFVASLPASGQLIFNGDDPASREVAAAAAHKVSFGVEGAADYQGGSIVVQPSRQEFILRAPTGATQRMVLRVPGRFNVYNALAASAAALEQGVSLETCQKVLADFSGLRRRFEKVGEYRGALVISDYGHHPTAIKSTLAAARDFYPGRRLILVYQPHQHNRTKNLFKEFAQALAEPDILILSDIYDVAGREEAADQAVSSRLLGEEVKKLGGSDKMYLYGGDLNQTLEMIKERVKPNDVLLIMGAGDIDWVARRLISNI